LPRKTDFAIMLFLLVFFMGMLTLALKAQPAKAQVQPQFDGPLIWTGVTETTVTLQWPRSGFYFFTGYNLFESSTGVNGPYTQIFWTGDEGVTSFPAIGLSSNTNYWFYVEEHASFSQYGRSNTLQVTTASNPWLWVASSDNTSATLAWIDYNTYSPSEPFVSYILQVSTSGPSGPWSTCASITYASQNNFTQMGLSATTGYWFQLYDVVGQYGNTFLSYSNTVVVPPRSFSVSISPSSVTMDLGQSQLFNSTVYGGTPPYSYQWGWYEPGPAGPANIPPANITWSQISSLASISSGANSTWAFTPSYVSTFVVYVDVTDNAGFQSGNAATVIVNPVPSVAISPSSLVMDTGQSQLVTSNVTGGTPPYSYVWYVGDQEINFHNTPLTINAFGRIGDGPNPFASPGSYTVCLNVTDSADANTISNNASITINPAPSVSISPTGATMTVGQFQTFNSTVSYGISPYTCQWFLNGTAVATSPTWTFAPTTAGFYTVYVNVTDAASAVAMSNIATVTVRAPALVQYTIGTSPLGLSVVMDGVTYGSPQTFTWNAGSVHTLNVNSPQGSYVFANWSDGLAQSHQVTVGTLNTTITAYFNQPVQYTIATNPSGLSINVDGTPYVSPQTFTWNVGSVHTLGVNSPQSGYVFANWSDGLAQSHQIAVGVVNTTVTAYFNQQTQYTIVTSPSGLSVTVDSVTFTSPQTFTWNVGSIHTLSVASPQGSYVFANWSDGGAQSHQITTGSSNTTITANFNQQPLVHDIAVTNVTTSKTGCTPMPTVGQNFTETVNVTVADTGNYTESTVNVTVYATQTAYYNTTTQSWTAIPLILQTPVTINFATVSLNVGQNTTLTFKWNITGFAYGNYTISATAGPVQGETNTGDNTFTNCNILVTIQGDINGDGKVSLVDLVLLASAYGSHPGDAKWNPNADINGNGVIDLTDLVTMAKYYEQTVL